MCACVHVCVSPYRFESLCLDLDVELDAEVSCERTYAHDTAKKDRGSSCVGLVHSWIH